MDEGLLDHIALGVPALDPATAWFQNHFGYVEYARAGWPGGQAVRMGPAEAGPGSTLVELLDLTRTTDLGPSPRLVVRVPDAAAVESLRNADIAVESVAKAHVRADFLIDVPTTGWIGVVECDTDAVWSVDGATLHVSDPDVAVGWYLRMFGYALLDRTEGADGWSYTLGVRGAGRQGTGIHLSPEGDRDNGVADWTSGHLGIATHDLAACVANMNRQSPEQSPPDTVCGGTRAITRDRSGYPIELVERPPDP